jgi:hypothetical protein
MKKFSSREAVFKPPFYLSLITIVLLMAGLSEAIAYDKYSDCDDCHGDFLASPYVSLANGANWGDSLHNVHRNDMLNSDCNTCHVSGDFDSVSIDSSSGGNGLAPISCMGCHGRDEDMGNDSLSGGRGAGLRQHHYTAGVEGCVNCHSDSNPASYTPVGEDVLPNYYANPGTNHPQIHKDPCNADGSETFAGAEGLDNDGDGSYDDADSDCTVMSTTYSVGGTVSGLTGSGLALQNNGADTLSIAANGSFTFATELEDGSAYAVTVSAQPTDQTCSVANGSGTIAAADVSNVAVTCEDNPPVGFQINAGLNDAWYNPMTDGQGFFVTVYPDAGLVFLSWFTYDTTLPPEDATANLGDPGHRWMTAVGTFSGNQAVLNVTFTSEGLFDTATEVVNDSEGQGTIVITFNDCLSGTVEYDLTPIDQMGIVPIERIVNDNVALCEMLEEDSATQQKGPQQVSRLTGEAGSELLALAEMNAGLNDAWFNPETNGQGFFITVFPDNELVFLSWFTFDTSLPPDGATFNLPDPGNRWLTAAGTIVGNQATMDIDMTSRGLFDKASDVQRTDPPGSDGTITLMFEDCNSGTVEYDITSIEQTGTVPIQRIVTDNVGLCDLLGGE